VKVTDINDEDRLRHNVRAPSGVIIRELDNHSELSAINARPGDVIRKIDEITVNTVEDFKKAIVKYRWKESIVILLQRGDSGYYITLQL
jgi:serine protease Do